MSTPETHDNSKPLGVIDTEDLPLKWGAYWLHPDGWYRLFPPNAEVSEGGPLTHELKQYANPPFAAPLG